VIGSSPPRPGLAERHNLGELPLRTGVPLLGALAAGAGSLTPYAFTELALASLHHPL
jgi:dethiobiotin synthetase